MRDESRGALRQEVIRESLAERRRVRRARIDFAAGGQPLGAVERTDCRIQVQGAADRSPQRAQWHLATALQPSQQGSLGRRCESGRLVIQRAQPSQRLGIVGTTGNTNNTL